MIRHIVALDRAAGMAKHGGQPWSIPDDEQYFTYQTKRYGGVVLVGMTTFLTFKKPLADRQNIILTHQTEPIAGATLVHDLDTFFANQVGDVWVVGGASLFAQTLHRADELYVTRIDADFGCDQQYPAFEDRFTLHTQSDIKEQNGFRYRYEIYTVNSSDRVK